MAAVLAILVAVLPALGAVGEPSAGDLVVMTSSGAPGLGSTTEAPPPSEEHFDTGSESVRAIRPGAKLFTSGGGCTANFVFHAVPTGALYLGTAAHCVEGLPPGASVSINNGSAWGSVAFSLWGHGSSARAGASAENDFALIAVRAEDAHLVQPAVERFGGPVRLADPRRVAPGDDVVAFGASSFRPGVHDVRGNVLLVHRVVEVAMPYALWGDSGAPALTEDGGALGLITAIGVVTRLDTVLRLTDEAGFPVTLVTDPEWQVPPLPV